MICRDFTSQRYPHLLNRIPILPLNFSRLVVLTPHLLEPLPLRWVHPARREEGRFVYVVNWMDCECNRILRFVNPMGGNTKGSPQQRRAHYVTALTASKQVSRGLHPGSLGKKYHKKLSRQLRTSFFSEHVIDGFSYS